MKRLRNRQLRISRIVLVLVGLSLLGIATVLALLHTSTVDAIGEVLDTSTPILNDSGVDLITDRQMQVVAVAVGVLAILIGIAWLARQVPPMRHHVDVELTGDLAPGSDRIPGRTVVSGAAIADALEADLERSSGIQRARVEFRGLEHPLRIRLDVTDDADIPSLVDEVVRPAAVRMAEHAGGTLPEDLALDLRPVGAPSRIVA